MADLSISPYIDYSSFIHHYIKRLIILPFGSPSKILHDQGRESENILFQRLHKLSTRFTCLRDINTIPSSIKEGKRGKIHLFSVLRTLRENKKERWKDSLNKVVHAYNCTRNNETWFSPFYLLFGRSPRLPFNLDVWSPRDEPGVTHRGYVKKWQISMKEAYLQAAKNILK